MQFREVRALLEFEANSVSIREPSKSLLSPLNEMKVEPRRGEEVADGGHLLKCIHTSSGII